MNVRYVFPLAHPLKVESHWPVPLLGGLCRLLEENGLVTAVEFTKSGLSADFAFSVVDTPNEKSKATITGRDEFLPFVRDHINRAFSFIQCYFDVGITINEVQVYHEAETSDEKNIIVIPSFHIGNREPLPLPLTYDFFTRALMASEEHDGPDFISSLASMAREALISKRYIDSFRFTFLLIESVFGGGKYKSNQLKHKFLASSQLCNHVEGAIRNWKQQRIATSSSTHDLMSGSPTVAQVVEHLVSMRGHYFHGNIAKKDAWNQSRQDEAEALAVLGVNVAQEIAAAAAKPMFSDQYSIRHFEEAGLAGAHVVMDISYFFRVPDEEFIRRQNVKFRMPGTKPTTAMAMEASRRSVQNFQEQFPIGRLHSISAKNSSDGTEVFFIRFFTEEDGRVVDD